MMEKSGLSKDLPIDDPHHEPNELGFNLERMIAGEESAKAGRTRSAAEAIRELREKTQ